jgi:hypothetical protein
MTLLLPQTAHYFLHPLFGSQKQPVPQDQQLDYGVVLGYALHK